MASALRHVFLVLVLTAALFFTHLLQHVDDNTETYAPKEWIGVLRKSTLATRAAGLQQWVTNRTHGLVRGTLTEQFARLESAEARLQQTLARIASQPGCEDLKLQQQRQQQQQQQHTQQQQQQQQQQQTGGLVAGAPESAEMTGAEAPGMRSEAAGAGCCGTFDGRPTCTTAEAIAEALRLIDLAQLEIEALEQQKAEKEEAVTARATAASADAPPEVRMQQLLLQQQQRQRQPKQAHAQHDAAAEPAPPKQRKPRHRDRADRQDGASTEATSVQPQGEAVAEFAY
jgi:hypothetical protein